MSIDEVAFSDITAGTQPLNFTSDSSVTDTQTNNTISNNNSGSFIDTAWYDLERAWYNLTGIGTPPIVLPADSIKTPAADNVRIQANNSPGIGSILAGTAADTTNTLVSGFKFTLTSIVIIAVAAFGIYALYKWKGK